MTLTVEETKKIIDFCGAVCLSEDESLVENSIEVLSMIRDIESKEESEFEKEYEKMLESRS